MGDDSKRSCFSCVVWSVIVPIVIIAIMKRAGKSHSLNAIVVIAWLPFLITALMILSLLIYFVARFFEFTRNGKDKFLFGDVVAAVILFSSFFSLVTSWESGLAAAHMIRGLKHYVILELEFIKWIELNLMCSAFCFLISLPRAILGVARGDIEHKEGVVRLINGFGGVIECSLFIAAEFAVMKFAPRWKRHYAFLGFQTWEFILALICLLLGIVVIDTVSNVIVVAVKLFLWDRKHAVYIAKGLRPNANFVLMSTLYLVVWIKCLVPRFHGAKRMEYVTWSFVCLTIGSVLWLVKKCIVLVWTAHAIYSRFHDKIIEAGKQFYFLQELGAAIASSAQGQRINNSEGGDFLSTVKNKFLSRSKTSKITARNSETNCQGSENASEFSKVDTRKRRRLLVEEKIDGTVPINQLEGITKYFQNIENELKKPDSKIATQFADHLRKIDSENISKSEDLETIYKDIYERELGTAEAKALYNQIQQVDGKEGVDAQKFQKWVVKAYRNCWELSNMVMGAKEIANYLNILLGGLFLLVCLLTWLLVTKIATIRLLLLVLSPLLAATFIFGDTCKSAFQGIVFAFVMRVFDVGDICIISATQMEVKRIGMWRTTFVKVETNEKVIYQNSVLTDKLIIRHKGGLDLNDFVECCVPTHTCSPKLFNDLREAIGKYVQEYPGRYQSQGLQVLVKEVGDESVKIAIHFKHKTGDQDMVYSECLRKLHKNKTYLLMKAREILMQPRH